MQGPHAVRELDEAALARTISHAAAGAAMQAEAELYRRLAPRVRLYGLRHLRDRAAADDLMQQVLVMTLEHLRAGKVRDPERIVSYVLGTCRMAVLEIRRGAKRREGLLELWGERDAVLEAPELPQVDGERLAGCLGGLGERERSVIVSSFVAEKPADEIARELGLTPGNARVIRHRALARLRACLEADRGAS